MGWPITWVVPKATDEVIVKFIYEEIFINFGVPREILLDNEVNLLVMAVKHFLHILQTHHHMITSYHSWTNGKIENLNRLLDWMLMKILMGKLTRLWDEFLPQVLFAAWVRCHATSKQNSFYLLYGVYFWISSDPNNLITDDATSVDLKVYLHKINHVRTLANKLLLNHAIKFKWVRDELVKEFSIPVGMWVLVHNEGPEKFQSK